MLSRHQETAATQPDLDLMMELHASCQHSGQTLYRLVSEMDDKEEGIGDLLKANDELSRVMGRYKLIVEGTTTTTTNNNNNNNTASVSAASVSAADTPIVAVIVVVKTVRYYWTCQQPEDEEAAAALDPMPLHKHLHDIGLGGIDLKVAAAAAAAASGQSSPGVVTASLAYQSTMAPTLIPQLSTQTQQPINDDTKQPTIKDERCDPLDDLATLGTSLIKQHLPPNTPVQVQFKPAEKLTAEEEEEMVVAAVVVDEINKKKCSSNPQFMEVKSMADLRVTLDSIKPGKQGSLTVLDSNDIIVMLHFTENQPRDDVCVVVISTISHNSTPITNYVLQAVVPKGCKVRLQSPSSTNLAAYTPFLPPPAITQIMMIANPNKVNVWLKIMLSYSLEDDLVTEMGQVDTLPL
ncbi:hypothetical protein Pcinc_039189 [Petrolisthes cinctipes]|uniref:Uncharacterized protein n=1 Tax=Petrolisthes cinctipes TaxID=88211 RepID=A0AAE1BSV8_PETCI|nr:hypothetical protein Pcinc_039189 [Petrolisthes cinctipes]